MQDLQEVTQEIHYENFRAERLATGGAQKRVKYVCMAFGCSPHLVIYQGAISACFPNMAQHYLFVICQTILYKISLQSAFRPNCFHNN